VIEQGRTAVLGWQQTIDAAWQRQSDLLADPPPIPKPDPGFDPFEDWNELGGQIGGWVGELGDRIRGYTFPSRAPDPNAVPGGRPTEVPPNQREDIKTAVRRENESAVHLARAGYEVEQNPPPRPDSGKRPDYRIEGEYFDNYAPNVGTAENVASTTHQKANVAQAERIILNTSDMQADLGDVQARLHEITDTDLKEVFVMTADGHMSRIYP
jgi:hypothetical protein